ncbi:MAG TPA: hypothetical protein VGF55_14760 [Gemmataceae bacterium]|jgi:hypothetical protein
MTRSDSEDRPRLLLLLIFAGVFGLLLVNAVRLWGQIDAQERWARAGELLLIAIGAWAVVWPESLPPWRRSKGPRNPGGPAATSKEGRAGPGAAADGGRDAGT